MDLTPAPENRADDRGRPHPPVDPEVSRDDRVVVTGTPTPAPRRRRRAQPRPVGRGVVQVLARRRDVLAVIALGGALGSVGRWIVAQDLPHPTSLFPWPTFAVNVAGSFLLGVLLVFVTEVWPPSRYVRPFFAVGVLGGFTTFSTYMLDTERLLVSGSTGEAGAYVFGTLAAGLCAVWLAIVSARGAVRLTRSRRPGHERYADANAELAHGGQRSSEASRRMR